MKKEWKILTTLMLIFTITFNCFIRSYASQPKNTVRWGSAVFDVEKRTFNIPIIMENNTGIMGFRLIVFYSSSVIYPVSVKRNSSLNSGMFADSISSITDGSFDILWSGSSEYKEDGEVCVVSFSFDDEQEFSFTLGLSYNKDDTFNEEWQDVELNCESEKCFYITNGVINEISPSFFQKLLNFFKKIIARIRSYFYVIYPIDKIEGGTS